MPYINLRQKQKQAHFKCKCSSLAFLTTFTAQNKYNIHCKTAPRSNITNEGTHALSVTIASFYISCQIFRNKHVVLCITMINMLYINLSSSFYSPKTKASAL